MSLFISSLSGASGETPSINPQTIYVEDDGYVHVIAMGQSNMYGSNAGGDVTTDSRVEAWSGSAWVLATIGSAPFRIFDGEDMNNLAFHFCKNLAETYDVKVRMQLVAWGSEPIIGWAKYNWQYQTLINPRKRYNMPKASIFLWHQGEADNTQPEWDVYEERYDQLVTDMTDDNLVREDCKCILGEVSYITATINDILNDIGDRGVRYYTTHTTDLDNTGSETGDEHFTGENLVILGQRYFTNWQILMDLIEDPRNPNLNVSTTPPSKPNLISVT